MESDLRLVPASTLAPRRAAVETSQVSPEQGLVLVPMHGMTTITVSGKDALSFLQSKLTVDVKAWQKTGGAFGYSVDINGRVLFDVHAALLGDDRVRMISEPDLGTTIFEALDKYIIMEKVDVVVEDISEHWLVAADTAEAIDTLLGLQPSGPGALSQLSALEVLALTRSARPARLLSGESSAVRAKLVEAGARYVTWEDWRAFEVKQGFVRTGFDLFRTETIPLEAGMSLGVEYNKGCYLGQEVIERLRSRGTPNREYRRVAFEGPLPASLPATLYEEGGREAGTLTSAVHDGEGVVGIAVIRRRALQEDAAPLHVESEAGPVLRIVGAVC